MSTTLVLARSCVSASEGSCSVELELELERGTEPTTRSRSVQVHAYTVRFGSAVMPYHVQENGVDMKPGMRIQHQPKVECFENPLNTSNYFLNISLLCMDDHIHCLARAFRGSSKWANQRCMPLCLRSSPVLSLGTPYPFKHSNPFSR